MQVITYKPLVTFPKIHITLPSISLKGVREINFFIEFMKKLYKKSVFYHFVLLFTANTR